MEIEMFFAKYDTDGDGVFRWNKENCFKMKIFLLATHSQSALSSWEEGAQIVEDLENDKIDQVVIEPIR